MAILDDKGRLFGKINLLDLAVVLVVLAAVGYLGYGYMNPETTMPAGEDKKIQVTFMVPQVKQPTIDQLQVGTVVTESKTARTMGKIVAVKTVPAKVTGPAGEYESKFAFDHYVTVEGNGRVVPDGVTMLNGLEMWVGGQNFMVAGEWKGTGITWGIDKNPGAPK